MKKSLRLLFTLLLLCGLAGCMFAAKSNVPPTVKIGDQSFSVEVARTAEERAQGLMGRESIPVGEGMLFVFPASYKHGFWMKNTLVPLDIIWISEDLEVVAVRRKAPPCPPEQSQSDTCVMYLPQSPARYALEVKAKSFAGGVGDKVEFFGIDVQ